VTVIDASAIEPLLREYLPKQRWFGAKDRELDSVTVGELDVLQAGWPALVHALVDTTFTNGPGARYQLFIGLRPDGTPADFLSGHVQAVIGNLDTDSGPAYAYDGLLDAELDLALLSRVAPKEAAWRARPVGTEQSNTSIVFDDRIILKVFRRLADGPNPDVEITTALADHGFKYIATPIASWSEAGHDLAVVQEYLAGGVEGWALAMTSLRDLYESPRDPSEAGGDFYADAVRLGEVTGGLHVALAEAFGAHPAEPKRWADEMDRLLATMNAPDKLDVDRLRAKIDRLRSLPAERAGPAIRVHGDYHLGQIMRTDAGWYVLDFEGEPARPLEERRRPTSPLKDVTGMLRSLQYAAHAAYLERDQADVTTAVDLAESAAAWEARNREGFLSGYTNGVDDRILPHDPADLETVMDAFELEKAVYELAYEQANRPDWAAIPLAALARLAAT